MKELNYGTNLSELDAHSEKIIEYFDKAPPLSINEAKARIEKLTGINRSPTRIQVFMKRHGLKYRKLGTVPGKADPERQAKWLEEILNPCIKAAEDGL